jgi:hypothetical protein
LEESEMRKVIGACLVAAPFCAAGVVCAVAGCFALYLAYLGVLALTLTTLYVVGTGLYLLGGLK